MAITYLTGFEAGTFDTSGGGLFNSATSIPTIQDSIVRNGAYALHISSSTSQQFITTSQSGTVVTSFALYVDEINSTPSKYSVPLATINPAVGAPAYLTYSPTSQKLGVGFSNIEVMPGTQTSDFSMQTWYWIDMKVVFDSNPRSISWKVNGLDQPPANLSSTASTGASVRLGYAQTFNVNSVSVFYDDFVVSNSSLDYPIGDIVVKAFRPNAAGTHLNPADFTYNNGSDHAIDSNAYTAIDDDPIDETIDYIQQNATNAASYLEFNFDDLDPEDYSILGMRGVVGFHSDTVIPRSQSFNSGSARLVDSSADQIILSQATVDSSEGLIGGSGTQEALSQSVTQISGMLNSIELLLIKAGSPTDNITVELRDSLDGNILDTSTVSAASIPTTSGWVTFPFSGTFNLVNATTYFFQASRSGARSVSNFISFFYTSTSVVPGTRKVRNLGSWTGGGDRAIKVHVSAAGATEYSIYSGNMSYSTTPTFEGKMLTPISGALWNRANFSTMKLRAGYAEDVTTLPKIDVLMLEVAVIEGKWHNIDAYLTAGTIRLHQVDASIVSSMTLSTNILGTISQALKVSSSIDALVQGFTETFDIDSLLSSSQIPVVAEVDAYLDQTAKAIDFSIDSFIEDTETEWLGNELL